MWFSLKLNTHCGCDVIQPVPAKLVLQTTIPEEAKSNNEVEHFPDASRVTVRKRPTVTTIEAKPASCFIIFSSMAFIFATKLIMTLLVSFRGLYNNFEGEVVEVRDAKKSLMKMLLANNRTVGMIDSFTVLYVDQIIFSKKMEKEKG